MGQPSKYHITDKGDVFRVNQDGTFTSVGNVEDQNLGSKSVMKSSAKQEASSAGTNYDLQKLENQIINNDLSQLSLDEVTYIAANSQNCDAILRASEYDDSIIIPILVKRFESGATFLEDAVLNGCQYDKNEKVRLAVANCKRKFDDDDILFILGKDKNPVVSNAAKSNPNYTGNKGGCFGAIIIFLITTLSFINYYVN